MILRLIYQLINGKSIESDPIDSWKKIDTCQMPALQLEGIHIQIRPLSNNDLRPLYGLETDKDVKRYIGGPVSRPRDEWIAAMSETLGPQQPTLAIVEKATGHFVGRATLSQNSSPDEWEVQVLIAKQYWGKKWGREATHLLINAAFTHLNASAVFAAFAPAHMASKNLVEWFNFEFVRAKNTCRWDNGHLEYKLRRENYDRWLQRQNQQPGTT